MKKLIAALVVCVGTTAFAAQEGQSDKPHPGTGLNATEVLPQKPGSSIEKAERDADKGLDATEVGPRISKGAKDLTGQDSDKTVKADKTLKATGAFDIKGTIASRSDDGITLERPGLPAAELDVRDETAVWLNGKKVKADALPEGAQVRAKFQIDGDDIVAVELRATSTVK
ncbi:hypothetical protein [Stigmatella erecta]|uniref:DUF5666 domain-containing protein n=1 Tax=Stigmatella erecta TaxID=83460 RepID=A0A1I0IF05_9BACT|nr:hypothetical protein [Stigmatella erecta]SET95468.1 hypothetical protein SAMN05443639_10620 [Stigmatella erecta]